jgi:hypothetical protein
MKKGFKKKKRILMKQEGKTVRESEQGHVWKWKEYVDINVGFFSWIEMVNFNACSSVSKVEETGVPRDSITVGGFSMVREHTGYSSAVGFGSSRIRIQSDPNLFSLIRIQNFQHQLRIWPW